MSIHWLATSLLAGTVIGAGIFSLPFVFQSAGLGFGFLFLLLGAMAYMVVHVLYADIIVRTEGEHRFIGYAKRYLGKRSFWITIFMTLVQMLFVMTIYLILAKSFTMLIIPTGDTFVHILVFWLIGSLALLLPLRRLALVTFVITSGMLAIMFLIFVYGIPDIASLSFQAFSSTTASLFLLPLAPILFSFSGRAAIPSIINVIGRAPEHYRTIRRSIIAGIAIPAVFYVLFVLAVIGISGTASDDAVTGLIGRIPLWAMSILGVLGVLSLLGSYIVLGFNIRNILRYDFKTTKVIRLLVVVGGPLLFYFLGFHNFIELISFVGGIFLALEAFLIVMMWRNVNTSSSQPPAVFAKSSSLLPSAALVLFAVALAYELFVLVRVVI